MRIDMHIHTRRYSACSHIDPYKLIVKARERGLDGIVITEHERLWSKAEIAELKKFSQDCTKPVARCHSERSEESRFAAQDKLRERELVILRGIEAETPQGLHFLIYGMDEEIGFGMNEEDIIRAAHKRSAVVIPAHPYRYGAGLEGLLCSLEIDGLEIMSTNANEKASMQAQMLRDKLGIPGIAGSDAHEIDLVGAYYTEFQSDITNEAELVEALKAEWKTISCHKTSSIRHSIRI